MTTPTYRQVPAQVDLPALEHAVLDFGEQIFAKSLEQLAEGHPEWVFYEGPPTANGMPGPTTSRRASSRTSSRAFAPCAAITWPARPAGTATASRSSSRWRRSSASPASRTSRRTASPSSTPGAAPRPVTPTRSPSSRTAWATGSTCTTRTARCTETRSPCALLKEIFNKGLLVEDYRVAPWCPRDETGLSDHELAQGYETVVHPSVYVRFPLTSGPLAGQASLLVWTTTPWTLVSNTAVAAHPEGHLRLVATNGEEKFVVAAPLVEKALGEGWETTGETFTGAEMERWTYQRPFELVEFPAEAHFVVNAEYVTTEDGTGLVHQLPAFGEDDLKVCRAYGLPVVNPVRPNGTFEESVPLVGGVFFKKADEKLTEDLQQRGLLFKHIPYEHSYPHSRWRCHTALLYYAQPSWYIRTTAIRGPAPPGEREDQLVPGVRQHGRFGDWLEQQRRLGAVPQPVTGHPAPAVALRGGPSHLCRLPRRTLRADWHRPVEPGPAPPVHRRGHLRVPAGRLRTDGDARAGGHRRLVRLGFDAVAQWGYPYKNKELFESRYPVSSISEAIDHGPHPHGGRHPSLRPVVVRERRVPGPHPRRGRPQDVQAPGQHPAADPADGSARRGRGALVHGGRRLPLGGPPRRSRHHPGGGAQDAPDLLTWSPSRPCTPAPPTPAPSEADPAPADRPVLDRWLLSELHALTDQVTQALEAYDTQRAGKLRPRSSTTSRMVRAPLARRFWQGDKAALRTLHEVVETVTRLMAPLTPFITERVWQDLIVPVTPGAPESVHLSSWPEPDLSAIDPELSRQMVLVRRRGAGPRHARGVGRQDAPAAVPRAGRGDRRPPAPRRELHAQITEELNVTSLASLSEVGGSLVDTTAKANFRALGKRFGKGVQAVAKVIAETDAAALSLALREGTASVEVDGETVPLAADEVIITETPREGWSVASDSCHGRSGPGDHRGAAAGGPRP